MSDAIAREFAKIWLLRNGPNPYAAELDRMAGMELSDVRKLWDAYDGTNSPLGFSGEAIHMELNLRGDGLYCAV